MRISLKKRPLTIGSETKTAFEWSVQFGLSWSLVKRRMGLGWDASRIFTESIRESHGHSSNGRQTATYSAWSDAKYRTSNPHCRTAEHYFLRNITMCERWKKSFRAFLEDMGERPDGMTLERINVNGNYEPGNCKWDSWTRQQNNKRNNRYITYNGTTKTLMEWSRIVGISHAVLRFRIKKWGDLHRAFTTPIDESYRRRGVR